MEAPSWLWIAFTLAAGAVQTVRNAMQRHLTERLGTIGATHVRFLFGLPFGLALLAGSWSLFGVAGLEASWRFFAWAGGGALAQIAATALMLATMRERSFVVAMAYVKTEPVLIAIFGLLFLGERLGLQGNLGVLIATAGVMLMSWPTAAAAGAASGPAPEPRAWLRPALFGVASGGLFALAAVGFRGGILALGDAPFHVRATTTLATSLVIQTALLTTWLLVRSPGVLTEILRAWRPSLVAGAAGAFASQLWFLAFSLQSAAAVRTVGLVELLYAQVASRKLFSQRMTRREAIGLLTMVAGLVMLLNA
jgi:drug/metabolite transporter (DMT)-like permease